MIVTFPFILMHLKLLNPNSLCTISCMQNASLQLTFARVLGSHIMMKSYENFHMSLKINFTKNVSFLFVMKAFSCLSLQHCFDYICSIIMHTYILPVGQLPTFLSPFLLISVTEVLRYITVNSQYLLMKNLFFIV